MELDSVGVVCEPAFPRVIEVVTRTVVDDQKEFPGRVASNQLHQELVKGVSAEHGRESVSEPCIVEANGAEDVCGLPLAEGVDAGLLPYARPRLVKRAVEPEARFVFEDDDASTRCGFFFIAGNLSRNQVACAARSARARRFRGR